MNAADFIRATVAWIATPLALTAGVWLLAIAFSLALLTEWAKLAVTGTRDFRRARRAREVTS